MDQNATTTLPSVRELFTRLPENTERFEHFLDELHTRYREADFFIEHEETTREQVETIVQYVLSQFDKVPLTPLNNNIATNEWVIIPQLAIEQNFEKDNTFSFYTSSSVFSIPAMPIYASTELEKPIALSSEYESGPYKNEHEAPATGYAYELNDWSEILSYRVWHPESFAEKQIVEFYVDIFWELTFCGVDYEDNTNQHRKIEDELAESIRQVEEAKENGTLDEVTHSYNISAILDEEYGPYRRVYQKAMREFEIVLWHNLSIYNYNIVKQFANTIL